jgi:hypothetical protein
MSEQAGSYVRKQSYRLQFHADRDGIAKVVEFFAADLTYAWELIKGDASHRDVDVWEDGRLVCQVSHDPSAVRLSRPAARAEPLDGFYRGGGCG